MPSFFFGGDRYNKVEYFHHKTDRIKIITVIGCSRRFLFFDNASQTQPV